MARDINSATTHAKVTKIAFDASGGADYQPSDPSSNFHPYDTSTLSFGLSGSSPARVRIIRMIEWVTGKITLLKIVRDFDRTGRKFEGNFWEKVLELLDISIKTPDVAIEKIPATGPLVVVANHPWGFVDGLVLANLVAHVRPDFKILTRSFFATLPEIDGAMVPVAFPHDENAVIHNIAMRKQVMEYLSNGGAVILFPAGRCATAKRLFGKAIEHEWNPFTAKIIMRSKARVVCVYFTGQNGALFQFVQHFSATVRQALMMHEIWRKIGKPVEPQIAPVMERDEIDPWKQKPKEFLEFLRWRTLEMERDSPFGIRISKTQRGPTPD